MAEGGRRGEGEAGSHLAGMLNASSPDSSPSLSKQRGRNPGSSSGVRRVRLDGGRRQAGEEIPELSAVTTEEKEKCSGCQDTRASGADFRGGGGYSNPGKLKAASETCPASPQGPGASGCV